MLGVLLNILRAGECVCVCVGGRGGGGIVSHVRVFVFLFLKSVQHLSLMGSCLAK